MRRLYHRCRGLLFILTAGVASAAPMITVQPTPVAATVGTAATFSVAATATAGSLSYQWQRNGYNISGATGTSFTISSPSRTNADYYDVVVTDSSGSVTSNVVLLTVAPTSYPAYVTPDSAWDIQAEYVGGAVNAVWPLADGTFYVAGQFTNVGGSARSGLFHVLASGSLDTAFAPTFDGSVSALTVQTNGQLVVGGGFQRVNGVVQPTLCRLNADGSLDTSFRPTVGGGTPQSLAMTAGGQIIVGGAFSTVDGVSRPDLARLNSDGTLDTSFSVGTGFNLPVTTAVVQASGKVVVAGYFTQYNGTTGLHYLARLNTDGSLDQTFASNVGTGANADILALAVDSNGNLLIGGAFTTFNGTAENRIARLSSSGVLDTTFATGYGFNGTVYAIAFQGTNLLVGGDYSLFNNVNAHDLCRLTSTGSLDTTFVPTAPNNGITSVAVQAVTGDLLIGGFFTQVGTTSQMDFARLTSAGILDSTVNFALRSGYNNISATVPLANGQVLVVGNFSYIRGVAVPANVARFNSDGSLDTTFNAGGAGPNGQIYAAAQLPDGRVVIGGGFSNYDGQAESNVVILKSDGTVDAGFAVPGYGLNGIVYTLTVLPAEQILIGGAFTTVNVTSSPGVAVLNSDGSIATGFSPGTGISFGGAVYASAAQANGDILLGGTFTSFNGTTVGNLVRLTSTGGVDSSFTTTTGADGVIWALGLQANGDVVIAGTFSHYNGTAQNALARLTTAGALDTGFVPPTTSAYNIYNILVQENGSVIARGSFGPVNGVSGAFDLARFTSTGSLDTTFLESDLSASGQQSSALAMRDNGQLFTSNNGTGFAGTTAATGLSIATQPTAETTIAGSSATFSVTAAGTGPFTYQWYFGSSPISGATSASYTLANAQPANAGNYSVAVASELGSATSNAVSLTVETAPVISAQPVASTVLAGATASFSVTASGVPSPSYQWEFNGSPLSDGGGISGSSTASLTITGTTLASAGNYAVLVSNVVGSTTSTAAALTVETVPAITAQPQAASVLAGASASFTVAATGTPAPTYQWYLNNNPISGATSATYSIASAAAANGGSYTVTVTNTAGNVTSNAVTLAVSPVIQTAPTAQTVTAGNPASFSVVATGFPAPTYQWSLNGSAISGATSATYAIGTVTTANAGSYTVAVTNSAGSVTSPAVGLTVDTVPVITSAPTAQAVAPGATATFSAAASGNPAPTYQWYYNSGLITGATSASYTITNVTAANGGSYTVTATNTAGSVSSTAVTLSVSPSIQTPPSALTVTAGNPATFTVAATGFPAPTYQWNFGGNPISGATSASYTIGSTASGNAGNYTVTVTNAAGAVTSAAAPLTVDAVPVFTTQPTLQSVAAGGTATFTSVASGNPAPTYQWYLGNSAISGATSASLTISNATAANGGTYTVIATNSAGSATSSAVTLEVGPAIQSSPATATVVAGNPVSFSVTASASPSPTYQWNFNGSPLSNGSGISGVTTATLSIAAAAPGNAGSYTVVVTNGAGSITSAAAGLAVDTVPTISSQPAGAAVAPGGGAAFTVVATGNPTPVYQWYLNNAAISGATNATYTLTNITAANGGSYTVAATNSAGSVTSNPAVLTVSPAIQSAPTGQTVTAGNPVSFSVSATGSPAPTYQWNLNGSPLANGNGISGATSATLAIAAATTGNAGNYTVTVTNPAGSVSTAAVGLTVNTLPVFGTQPVAAAIVAGGSATFTASASGSPPPTFQWFLNGNPITGATAATLTISNATAANGGSYTVVVTNAAGSVTSTPVTLAVGPVLQTGPTDQTVTAGNSATFTVVATGFPAPSYQWYFNNSPLADGNGITGSATAALTLAAASPTNAGNYTVTVSNTAGSVTSAAAALTVNTLPVITAQPAGVAVIAGGNASFRVTATGSPAPTFQWSYNGTPLTDGGAVSGSATSLLTITGAQLANAGNYTVTVTNAAGSVTSGTANLAIEIGPVITSEPTAVAAAAGATASFTVGVTGSPAPTYQWYLNGNAVSGATNATLTIPNVAAANGGNYTVTATNVSGSATSTPAALTVGPAIQTQPAAQIVNTGSPATFTVAASGFPAPTYRWYLGTSALTDGNGITGSAAATLTIASAGTATVGSYSVAVTNSVGTVTSAAASLSLEAAPTITTQPQGASVAYGGNVTFTVAATGNPAPTYQWYLGNSPISGATSATLVLTNLVQGNAGSYTVKVSNEAGTVSSSAAVLNVLVAAPTITGQPTAAMAAVGTSASFSVAATGTPAPTYQWYFDGTALANGNGVSGATAATLTLSSVQVANAGSYTVVATNLAGSAPSTPAMLVVTAATGGPAITLQPASQTLATGSTVVFSVNANGSGQPAVVGQTGPARTTAISHLKPALSGTTYQWFFNGTLIPGATASTLVITAGNATAGAYTCLLANSAGTLLSTAATLTVSTTNNPGRLGNESVLTQIQGTLTVGFVIGGTGTSGSENLLVRATGPALAANFQLTGTLPDPTLAVIQQSNSATLATDSGWGSNQTAVNQADNATGAFPLTNPASLDSALVTALPSVAGGYTVQVSGKSGDSGLALTELYDNTANYTATTPRLVNLSCRTTVAANGSLSVGFVVGGATSKTVLVRASGPALTAFSVTGVMPDPQIVVEPLSSTTVLAADAGWGGSSLISTLGGSVGAFPYTNPNSLDSAVVLTLAPGGYTAQVSSVSGTVGVVLVEVYEVP